MASLQRVMMAAFASPIVQSSAFSGLRLFSAAAQTGRSDVRGFFSGRFASAALLSTAAAGAAIASQQSTAQADAAKQDLPVDEYDRPGKDKLHGLPKEVVLYQYEVCPWCCKVKAVMDFYKIPYKAIEVNPLTKAELKWSTYKKVPVVKLDDEVLTSSSSIISRLAAEVEAAPSSSGRKAPPKQSAKAVEEEKQWRRWVDERFIKILTANIYRSWGESVDTFKYITEQTNWSWGTREIARWSGAVIMWQIGKKMPAKYNIEGDLREALYAACNEFVDAIGPKRPFMGGDKPNLADLAVYGVLKAVERTPTYEDALANSKIKPWVERTAAAIGSSARVSTEGSTWGLAPPGTPVTKSA